MSTRESLLHVLWVTGFSASTKERRTDTESRRVVLLVSRSALNSHDSPQCPPHLSYIRTAIGRRTRGETTGQTDRERSGVVSSSRAALIIVDGQFQQDKWVTMKWKRRPLFLWCTVDTGEQEHWPAGVITETVSRQRVKLYMTLVGALSRASLISNCGNKTLRFLPLGLWDLFWASTCCMEFSGIYEQQAICRDRYTASRYECRTRAPVHQSARDLNGTWA